MSNLADSCKEILEQAIEKAIDGGWDVFSTENHQIDVELITLDMLDDPDNYHNEAPHPGLTVYIRRNGYYAPYELIFNHDFAKALWGDKEHVEQQGYDGMNCYNCDADQSKYIDRCWEAHLQAMVIADDPIKYLRENI